MGAMSGGPLLLPLGTEEGEWHFCLGGLISEARSGTDFETVVAVRAHFIQTRRTIIISRKLLMAFATFYRCPS
jgi:hypothetical protein